MARLRFPGRPGQRFGRSLIRFMPHEARNSQKLFFNLTANIQKNLRWFYDTFGDSDEEEEFSGFTLKEDELNAYQRLKEESILELRANNEAKRIYTTSHLPPRVNKSGRMVRNVVRRSYAAMLRGEEDLSPKSCIARRPEELVGYRVAQNDVNLSSDKASELPSKTLTTIKIKLLPDGKKAKIVRHRRPPTFNTDFIRHDVSKNKELTQQRKRTKMMQDKFMRDTKARQKKREKLERERRQKKEKLQREKLKRQKEKEKVRMKKIKERTKKQQIREKKKANALAKKEKLKAKKRAKLGLAPEKTNLDGKSTVVKSKTKHQDMPQRLPKSVNVAPTKNKAAKQILARAKGQRKKPMKELASSLSNKRTLKKSLKLNDMVTDTNFLQRSISPTSPMATGLPGKASGKMKSKTKVPSHVIDEEQLGTVLMRTPVVSGKKRSKLKSLSKTGAPLVSDRNSSDIGSPPSANKIAGAFFLPSFSARSSRVIKPCKRYFEDDMVSPSTKLPSLPVSPQSVSSISFKRELLEEQEELSSFADVSSNDDFECEPLSPVHKPFHMKPKVRKGKVNSSKIHKSNLSITKGSNSKSAVQFVSSQKLSSKMSQPVRKRVNKSQNQSQLKRKKGHGLGVEKSPKSAKPSRTKTPPRRFLEDRENCVLEIVGRSLVLGSQEPKKSSYNYHKIKSKLATSVLQEMKGSHRAHLMKLAKDKKTVPLSGEVKTPQHSRPIMGGDKSSHLDAVSKQMAEAMEADMSPEQMADKPTKNLKQELQVEQQETPAGRGPRIKHVCRRASVALGLEVATFTKMDIKPEHTPSAIPQDLRESKDEAIKSETPQGDDNQESPSKYSRKNRGANYKKIRDELINDEVVPDEDRVPHRRRTKSISSEKLPFGHSSRFRVAPFTGPKLPNTKRHRCGQCTPCQRKEDCAECEFCLDKTKFGGPNTKRQACIFKKCWNPIYKHQRQQEVQEGKRPPPAFQRRKQKQTPGEGQLTLQSRGGQQGHHRTSPFKQRARHGKLKARIKLPTHGGAVKVLTSNVPMSRLQRQRMEKDMAKLRKFEANRNSSSNLTVAKQKAKAPVQPLKVTNHRINIDFKEDYDIEVAWLRGMAILSSEPMVPRTVCYLCGSTGKHELIYCNVCCEPFHSFCLEDEERPLEGEKENWCCQRCKFCHVCGMQEKLLTCDKCHSSYHPECLGPNYPTKPSKRRKIWVCTKCVKCKSCGATTPGQGSNAQWSHDFSLCQDCGKLFDKGNYCPICSQCYEDDDYVSKMMQCAKCDRWVHAKCEGLTEDMYHIMTDLPETVPYICVKCDLVRPAKWQIELEEEMEAGFQNVLRAMLNCRSASHLVNLEKKVKSSRSAHRSSSPASSSGLRRDLTPSPALSDTLSGDSYSSPSESKTDLITRRVSPRFLKEQKLNTGSPSLRPKEKTEVGVDSVSVETTDKSDMSTEGNSLTFLELENRTSETNSAKVLHDGERTESMELQPEHGHGSFSTLPEAPKQNAKETQDSTEDTCSSHELPIPNSSDLASGINKSGLSGEGETQKENDTVVFSESYSDMGCNLSGLQDIQDQEDSFNISSVGNLPKAQVEHTTASDSAVVDPTPATVMDASPMQDATSAQGSNQIPAADITVQLLHRHSLNRTNTQEENIALDGPPEQSCDSKNSPMSMLPPVHEPSGCEAVVHVQGDELDSNTNAPTEEGPLSMDKSDVDTPVQDLEKTGVEDQSLQSGSTSINSQQVTGNTRIPAENELTSIEKVKDKTDRNDDTGTDDSKNLDDSITVEVEQSKGQMEKVPKEIKHPKDLRMVSKRVSRGHYKTVGEFCDDCVRIIQHSLSSETDQLYNLKRNNRTACSVFLKNMNKMFPWYKVETSKSWEQNQKYPDGMLSQAVLPPHSDHEYAQWMQRKHPLPGVVQPSPLKRLPFSPTSRAPARIIGGSAQVTPLMEPNTDDTRRCCLCGRFSDEDPNDGGRLLYCGQDEWIHINCGLWSAEVFEEIDGSLVNVHAAIWRGRQLRCENCNKFGATVGCCQRGCPANFHFMCAREIKCVFQEDKKVFCNTHRDKVDRDIIQDGNFAVLRRVCVSLDNMKLNRNFTQGLEVSRINVMVGSLTVDDLGRLGPSSDQQDALYPLEFRCQRVYWSTFDAQRRCVYTIRIFECKVVSTPKSPLDVNHTTAHSPGVLNNRKSQVHISELPNDMPCIPEEDEGLQLRGKEGGVEMIDGVFELSLDSTGLESLLDPETLLQCEADLREGCIDPEMALNAAFEQINSDIAMEIGEFDLSIKDQPPMLDQGLIDLSEDLDSSSKLSKSCPSFGLESHDPAFQSSAGDARLTQSWPIPPSNVTGLSEKTLKSLPQSALANPSLTMMNLSEDNDLSNDLNRMVMSLNNAAQSGRTEEIRRRSSQDSNVSSDGVSIAAVQSSHLENEGFQEGQPTYIVGSSQYDVEAKTEIPSSESEVSATLSTGFPESSTEGASTGTSAILDSGLRNCELTATKSVLIPLSVGAESSGKSRIESPNTATSLFQSETAITSNGPQFSSGAVTQVTTLPVSSLNTPPRSVFKFINNLLTHSPEDTLHTDNSPEVKTLNTENSLIIGNSSRAPCQSSVQGSTTTSNRVQEETAVKSNNAKGEVTSTFCLRETFDSDLNLHPKDSQENAESSDNTDTLKEEIGLGSQESTDDDTNLSQLTRDIVTDVIAMEKLSEQSAVQSANQSPLSSAVLGQSELSKDNKDSSINDQRGDEAPLKGDTTLHQNERNSFETKSSFTATQNEGTSESSLSDLEMVTVPLSSTPNRQIHVPMCGAGQTQSDSPKEGDNCENSACTDDLTLEQVPEIALQEDRTQDQSPIELSSQMMDRGNFEPAISCEVDFIDPVNLSEENVDSTLLVATPHGEIDHSETRTFVAIEPPVVSSSVNQTEEASDPDQSEHMDVDDEPSAQEENNFDPKSRALTSMPGAKISPQQHDSNLGEHVQEEAELLLNLSSNTSGEEQRDDFHNSSKESPEECSEVISPSEEIVKKDVTQEPCSHSSDEEILEPPSKKIKLRDSLTMFPEKLEPFVSCETQSQKSSCPEYVTGASPPVPLGQQDQKEIEKRETSLQEELREEVDGNVIENQIEVENTLQLDAKPSENIRKDSEKSHRNYSPGVEEMPSGSSNEDLSLVDCSNAESQLRPPGNVNLSLENINENFSEDNQSNEEPPGMANKLNPKDTFVALRKAIVVLHDICGGQSKQAQSLSCSLPLTPSTDLGNSLPTTPEHQQDFSDRSAPLKQNKSQSLPNTPCLERSITSDLTNVLEDFKEENSSEPGVGLIVNESDKVLEKHSPEVSKELLEKIKEDDTCGKSIDKQDGNDALIVAEPRELADFSRESFVLDEKTGVFVPGPSDSETKKDDQDDFTVDKMDVEESPSSRKKYPMRATFSRLTRLVETPKENQSRQRRTSSVSISSEEMPSEDQEKLLSKDGLSQEVEMREEVAENEITSVVKKRLGRPKKIKVSNTPVCVDDKSELKANTPILKRGPGRPRKVHKLVTSDSVSPEIGNSTPVPCQRTLRKRTPQSQPQTKHIEKSRKRPREEAESDDLATSSKDPKVKVDENKLEGVQESQQPQESNKASETQLKTPEEDTTSASSNAVKPARRWPLKRVMGDFVSNKELLDLWTGLQPDMGPLKPNRKKTIEKDSSEVFGSDKVLFKASADESTKITIPDEVRHADNTLKEVPVIADASERQSQLASSEASDTSLNCQKDYLKVIFRSHTSSQRAKLSTNQSAPNNKGKTGDCVITSRKVISVSSAEFTKLKSELKNYHKKGGVKVGNHGILEMIQSTSRESEKNNLSSDSIGAQSADGSLATTSTVRVTSGSEVRQREVDKHPEMGRKSEEEILPPVLAIQLDKPTAGKASEEHLPPVLVRQLDKESVVKSSEESLPPVLDTQHGEQISRKASEEISLNIVQKVVKDNIALKTSALDLQTLHTLGTSIQSRVRPGSIKSTISPLDSPRIASSVPRVRPLQPIVPKTTPAVMTIAITSQSAIPNSHIYNQQCPVATRVLAPAASMSGIPGSVTTTFNVPVASSPFQVGPSFVSCTLQPPVLSQPLCSLVSVPIPLAMPLHVNSQPVSLTSCSLSVSQPSGALRLPWEPKPFSSQSDMTVYPSGFGLQTRRIAPLTNPSHSSFPLSSQKSVVLPDGASQEGHVTLLPFAGLNTVPVPFESPQPIMSISTSTSAVEQLWSIIQQKADQTQCEPASLIQEEINRSARLEHAYAAPRPGVSNPLKRPAAEDLPPRVGAKKRKSPHKVSKMWFDEFGMLQSKTDSDWLAKLDQQEGASTAKKLTSKNKAPRSSRPRPRIKNASGPRMKMPTISDVVKADKQSNQLIDDSSRSKDKPIKDTVKAKGQRTNRPSKGPSRIPPKLNLPNAQRVQTRENKENIVDENPTPVQANNGYKLIFEVTSDDGFQTRADTMEEAWRQVVEKVQERRIDARMKSLSFSGVDPVKILGVKHDALVFLIEQLYGTKNCKKYQFKFHQRHAGTAIDEEPPLNPHGCARAERFTSRSHHDIFDFLASRHRKAPELVEDTQEQDVQHKSSRRATSLDLPMAMRFRHLKETAKEAVGVYRSFIHGRGLFCKRPIEAGEMVIEYSGNVIRAILTDKREKYYESKGIGCYMFRIDDFDVVDATVHGNAARFINHSCDPNCFSRVIQIDGKKHIVIFASRKIHKGEELTYDYKFPIEDVKIPCNCGAPRCRKYLN